MGDNDISTKYISAAKHLLTHEKRPAKRKEGFLYFCEALTIVSKDPQSATELLRKATVKSAVIKEYIDYSTLIKDMCENSPNIDKVFHEFRS